MSFPSTLPCPVTGRAFPSGFEIGGTTAGLTITNCTMRCPHCRAMHRVDFPPLLVDGEPPRQDPPRPSLLARLGLRR